VNRQRAVISRLKAKVREQAGIIRGLRSRVEYLNGVVRDYTWHVFSSKLASQRYLEIQRGQGLNLEGSQLSGTWAYMTFQGQRIEDLGMDIGRQTQENWTLRGDNAGLTDELGKWRQAHIDLWHLANAALDDIYGTGSVWDGLPDALGELCEVSCIGSGGVITDPRELCDLGKESPICGGPGALP